LNIRQAKINWMKTMCY